MSCPALALPADLVAKHERLVFAALAALQPAPALLAAVHSVQQRLQGRSGSKAYTVLHLKAEQGWIAHCTAWAAKGGRAVAHR